MKRRLFAMGGGGFQMEPEDLRLDRFFLGLTAKGHPRVLLVPTASGDSRDLVERFERACVELGAIPSVLSLFRGTRPDLDAYVREHDVVYVTGGNTRNMLVLWREWGLDRALRGAYDAGVVVGGLSAGSLAWFEAGVTDSVPGTLSPIAGLGWLAGSHCPHYDGEPGRKPAFESMIADGSLPAGVGLDDGVGVLYEDERRVAIVTSREGRGASFVDGVDGASRTRFERARWLDTRGQ
jgi:dipeptidase E